MEEHKKAATHQAGAGPTEWRQGQEANPLLNVSADHGAVNAEPSSVLQRIVNACGGHFLEDGTAMIHCLAHHDPNPSLHLTVTEDSRLLVHCLAGCGQEAVIQALRDQGLWATSGEERQHVGSDLPPGVSRNWYGAPYANHWTYRGTKGETLGHVARYGGEDGKQVVPFFKVNGNKWKAGAAKQPRPLYSLHKLAKTQPETPVLIAEGEKAADAAQRLLGRSYVCMTWPGGTNAVTKADWSPLQGRNVVIWPDADDPGRKAAKSVAEQCQEAGARSARTVEPPQGKSSGWDLADAKAEGWTGEQVKAWIAERSENPSQGGIKPLSLQEFLTVDIPEREYLLRPPVPSQGIVMIYGARGIAKTFFTAACGLAIAAGDTALCWSAPRPARVLYVDGEMPAKMMQERISSLLVGMDREIDPQNFQLITPDLSGMLPNLATIEGQAVINNMLDSFDVLILDNLSALVNTGKESGSDEWHPVQGWLLELRRQGKTTILVHHAGKGGDQRGTSKREDPLDTVVKLSRPPDYQANEGARIHVHLSKARGIYGSEAEPFEAKLESTPEGGLLWTTKPLEDAETEMVKSLLDEGLSIRAIAQETGLNRSKVERLKKKVRQ
jgi:putative DNA primase/helicase